MTAEVLTYLPDIQTGLALIGFALAFTAKQRAWIKERDGNKCQATVRHECNEDKYPLEVDHLLPQRYLSNLGVPWDYIDRPENALTKCRAAHDLKHPDRIETRKVYHQKKAEGKDAFAKLFEERAEKLKKRQIYWNDQDDRKDTVVALRRTAKFINLGNIWPVKKSKNTTTNG